MYHDFVPAKLRPQANALIAELKALCNKPATCPYCQSTQFYATNLSSGYYRCQSCNHSFNRSLNTPFYRLAPLEWLPIIAEYRLSGQSYASISHKLDCTSWVVKRRVAIIDSYMKKRYPELYKWYQGFIHAPKSELPKVVKDQAKQLKMWVTDQLQVTNATCPYCDSSKTLKVGEARAQFRCKNCWRYFSHLKGTGLEHLGNSENWLKMIDMLVEGKAHRQIGQKLNISQGTITKTKRNWLNIMQRQDLLILKEWITARRG